MVSLDLAQFRTGHIRNRSQMRYNVGQFFRRYGVAGKLRKLQILKCVMEGKARRQNFFEGNEEKH